MSTDSSGTAQQKPLAEAKGILLLSVGVHSTIGLGDGVPDANPSGRI
ncbi:MAG: hypothetical protein QG626_396 [Patescibacteria group bacterium]|nr:hypothetical protein [Patescibacteria group bacterium]